MTPKQLRASLYDKSLWPESPSVDEVRAAFEASGLTLEEAGALIYCSGHAFKKWTARSKSNARAMQPALWQFWCSRVARLRGWPEDWAANTHSPRQREG